MSDFSNIWQFVIQQRCQNMQAERREMKYTRARQLASMRLMQAEKLRAMASAEADRERFQREQAEAIAERQRADQKQILDQQREEMAKEIMRLLHQQVAKDCCMLPAGWPPLACMLAACSPADPRASVKGSPVQQSSFVDRVPACVRSWPLRGSVD